MPVVWKEFAFCFKVNEQLELMEEPGKQVIDTDAGSPPSTLSRKILIH